MKILELPKMLFLDDVRFPQEAANYMYPIDLRKCYRDHNIDIVRNYEQFCNYLEKHEMPDAISFDHDLADEHYTPEMYWNNKEHYENKAKSFKEKTGYECAIFLLEYCEENQIDLPIILCHSMNPIGKKRILNLFK